MHLMRAARPDYLSHERRSSASLTVMPLTRSPVARVTPPAPPRQQRRFEASSSSATGGGEARSEPQGMRNARDVRSLGSNIQVNVAVTLDSPLMRRSGRGRDPVEVASWLTLGNYP